MAPTLAPVVIPDQLRGRGLRFTRLRPSVKGDPTTGKAPIDSGYYEEGNFSEDDSALLSHLEAGGGYGLVCNFGDLAVFDADELARLNELGIMARLPPLLTDEATPDSRHCYFICPGLDKKIVLYDPELTEEIPIEDEAGNVIGTKTVRRHLGEIQAGRAHIVGPDSPHWAGARRRIVDDSPLPNITPEELSLIIDGLALSRSLEDIDPGEVVRKARRNPTCENFSDQIAILDVVPSWRWNRQSGEELKCKPLDHGSKSGTALAINPVKNVWRCHACESGGSSLELLAVDEGIIKCNEARPGCLTGEKLKRAITTARNRGLLPPDPVDEARIYLEVIVDELRKDPSGLNDSRVLGALKIVREGNPLFFETYLKKARIGGDTKRALLSILDAAEFSSGEDECSNEEDEEIKAEAARIISEGRSFEHIYKVWQSRHLGDGRAGKALFISVGAQSCSNTAGINIILNGPRGCGKSDVLQKAGDLLPDEYLLFGDMSPQAVYYHAEEMPEGAIVAFDDITWNDTYASVQKRCTTQFQTGADHRTVTDGKPRTFRTKPRLTFWCTSVDRQFDEQLQDRYFAVDIEDSTDHKEAVISFMKARDAGIDQESEERETRICRAILRDLKDHLFEIVIPYADRITLLDGVGERGYKILSDMVKAFCAFRYAIRETDDRGRLIAIEEDFESAKAVFDEAEGHGEEKYTEPEKRVLRAIISCAYVASLESLVEVVGLSSGRIKDILNGRGRDDQRRYGLLAKCPALTVKRVSETIDLDPHDPGKPKSKTITRNEYFLDHNFRLAGAYNSLVYLEPATGDDDARRRQDDVEVDAPETDVRREVDVVNVEREIESTSGTSHGGAYPGAVQFRKKITLLDETPKNALTSSNEPPGGDSKGVNLCVEETSGDVADVTKGPDKGEPYHTISGLDDKDRTPAPKSKDDDRIFGLTPSYYLDLGGGKLPTVRALMDDQGWDDAKAGMALGMLKARGVKA